MVFLEKIYMNNLFTAAILIISYILITRRRSPANLYDPIIYFYYYHLVFFGIGLLYFDLLWDRDIEKSSQLVPVLLLLQYSILIYICDILLRRRKLSAEKLRDLICSSGCKYSNRMISGAYLVFAIGVACSAIYVHLAIGFDSFLSAGLDDVRVVGRQGYGWLALVSISAITVPAIYIMLASIVANKQGKSFIVVIVAFCVLLTIGNRGPAFEILVFYIVTLFLTKKGRIDFKWGLTFAIFCFLLLGALNLFRQGDEFSFALLCSKSLWRPYVNIDNFNVVYNYFQHSSSALYGYGYFLDFSVIMPGYQPNFGLWFKEIAGMDFTGGGVTVTYAGEILANFGKYPLFIISSFYFFIIYLCSLLFLHRNMSCLRLTHIFILSITLKSVVSSGIVSPIIYTYIPMVVILVILRLVANALFLFCGALPSQSIKINVK